MRTVAEILKEIDILKNEIFEREMRKQGLRDELTKSVSMDFEKEHGIVRGDLLETERYGRVFYDHVKLWGGSAKPWICVRDEKKDGTPSRVIKTLSDSCFKNAKLVGHYNLDEL